MYWVILCINTWFLYDNGMQAVNDYVDASSYVSSNECSEPKFATEKDVEFYRSTSFYPLRSFEPLPKDPVPPVTGEFSDIASTSTEQSEGIHYRYEIVRTKPSGFKLLRR